MIRILIADDHAMVRGGLKQILAMASDIVVVGESNNGTEVMEQLRCGLVDVLLLDMNMPGVSGVELIRRLCRKHPSLRILILSMHNEGQVVSEALRAGAAGYVAKDSEPEILLAGISKVAVGGRFIDPSLVDAVVFGAGHSGEPGEMLTERELQVLRMIGRGQSLGEIAGQLHLSPKTISTHKMRLMQKLNINNNADLIRYVSRHGLISE